MEGFELLSTGAWSILPPLLALGLALITKEVYSSLLVGVFSGLIIYEFCLEGVGFDSSSPHLRSSSGYGGANLVECGAYLVLGIIGRVSRHHRHCWRFARIR